MPFAYKACVAYNSRLQCMVRVVVKMYIDTHSKTNLKRISEKNENYKRASFRTNRVEVLDIYDKNNYHYHFAKSGFSQHKGNILKYKIGQFVESEFDDDIQIIDGKGIHFFLSVEPAWFYMYNEHNGQVKTFDSDGFLMFELYSYCCVSYYNNNKLLKSDYYEFCHASYYNNGNMIECCINRNSTFWLPTGEKYDIETCSGKTFYGYHNGYNIAITVLKNYSFQVITFMGDQIIDKKYIYSLYQISHIDFSHYELNKDYLRLSKRSIPKK